jgi:thioredoxin reductase
MRMMLYLLSLCIVLSLQANNKNLYIKNSFGTSVDAEWLIIGAGPAGITTIGTLLDLGIPAKTITWVDPEFNVGRIGKYYENVPANTSAKDFVNFINACNTFQDINTPAMERLRSEDPGLFPNLKLVIDPLQDITEHLKTKVPSIKKKLTKLDFENGNWHAVLEDTSIAARHVVLAMGSHPRTADYDDNTHQIPLDHAIDKEKLQTYVTPDDTVGVFGGSHSAILILKFLTDLSVKQIYNFYKRPLLYAVDMDGWLLHNANGLKGNTAQWAKEVLEKNPPENLMRVCNNEENRRDYLPECTKTIYAIGFEPNDVHATVPDNANLSYDDSTGIIGPRLFGIGIAFPEQHVDPMGNTEHRVGLNSFMEYAQEVIPQWATHKTKRDKYMQQKNMLKKYKQLFAIDML